MSQTQDIKTTIRDRFFHLMIELEEAKDVAGDEFNDVISVEETEQGNARRELLRMEKLAKRDKELNKRSQENAILRMSKLVHATLEERMQESINDIDELTTKVIGLDTGLAPLLDLLSTRAATISKVEPLVLSIPWLATELLKLVNTPKYRRTDAKGKAIVVEQVRIALGYFGFENLKLIIPALAFKRTIPQVTDPYPSIKHRLWQKALGTGITSLKLAEMAELERSHAFILGMLHEVGKVAVVRMYFRLFDKVLLEAQEEAELGLKKEEFSALTKVEPSIAFLTEYMVRYAKEISGKVVEHLGFKRVFINPAMQEFVAGAAIAEMSPMARCFAQANAYNKFRMLKSAKLINMDEAKAYLSLWRMPKGSLAILKTTDLSSLDKQFIDDDE